MNKIVLIMISINSLPISGILPYIILNLGNKLNLMYYQQVYHPPESEFWYLDISSVTFRDAGVYECQVSTSPKVFLPVHLTVLGEFN